MTFAEPLQVTFEKQLGEDKATYKTAYFNCRTKTVTNADDIPEALKAEILQKIG